MEKEIYLDFTLLETLKEEEKNKLNEDKENDLLKDVNLKILNDKSQFIDLKLLELEGNND